jgi:F420-dependent oxidoreductase-like protein
MEICLMVEGQEGVTWDQWLALAEACEDGRLDGLFRSDHYSSIAAPSERDALDAWATLAGLAARTRTLRLGTLVSPATFRHPSVLAKNAVTVDHISGGRVEVGFGAGWYEHEHTEYGFTFGERRERLERFAEQIEIVHRSWTQETFSFDGSHYRLEECRALPRPLQQPHPPLIVGGSGGRGTVEPAVRFADEYNTVSASAEGCRQLRSKLDAACEAAGRDPATLRFSLMTRIFVGSDRAEARERVRRALERERDDTDVDAYVRENEDAAVIGDVDEVAERLRELERAGVERVMLQHLVHEDLETVELLAAQVRPELERAGAS